MTFNQPEALRDTRVVLLAGPRQAGKTALAQRLTGNERRFLTLDDVTVLDAARRDPVGFVRGLDRAVIDEARLAPGLLLAIKRGVDADRGPDAVVTGIRPGGTACAKMQRPDGHPVY